MSEERSGPPSKYEPGTYALSPAGNPLPQERKSPPLSRVAPEAEGCRRIPKDAYVGAEYLALEAERLWTRAWLCAGPESDVRQAGDWFVFDLGDESILVVRGTDGRLHAMHNVCQHRGHRLATAPFGQSRSFICGFHGWRYDLGGRCVGIPDREHFHPDALTGSCDLPTVRCDTAAGLVFVCLDGKAPPLARYLGEIPELLAAYRLADMNVVRDVVVDVAANWKTVKHANLEAYHFPRLHPLALPIAEDLRQQVDFYPGGHNRFITTNGNPSSRLKGRTALDEGQKYLLAEVGIDPDAFEGGPYGVRRAIQLAKRRRDNAFGLDYSGFSDNQLTDDWSFSVFPNLSLNAHPEGVLLMRYLPDRSDPNRSRFHVMVLAPRMKPGARPPGYMGVGPDEDVSGATRPSRRYTAGNDPQLGWALDDDVFAVQHVQSGMRSSGFRHLRLGELEQRIQHFASEYRRYLDLED
jgi:phenylpropionate dioxygenase-like ring-hydroxylating dioxygenase large terminal subunit